MSVHAAPNWTATGAQAQHLPMTGPPQRLRLLMLHSFRTSAAIFKQQVGVADDEWMQAPLHVTVCNACQCPYAVVCRRAVH